MSHELRTPLNIIIGYSEMLEEMAEEGKVHKFIPDLKKIQSAANHQLKLVSNILDITKIEEGKIEITPSDFDVEMMISDIVSEMKPLMLMNHNKFNVNFEHKIGEMYSNNTKVR